MRWRWFAKGLWTHAPKLVLEDFLLLFDEHFSLEISLQLKFLFILCPLGLKCFEPLLLQRVLVGKLLLFLLAQESELLFHLHASKESLFFLLLTNLIEVFSTHAVECNTSFLGFVQLLYEAFLVSYDKRTYFKSIHIIFMVYTHCTFLLLHLVNLLQQLRLHSIQVLVEREHHGISSHTASS